MRDALSLFDQVYAFTGANIQDEDVAKLLGLIDRELLREEIAHTVAGPEQIEEELKQLFAALSAS